MSSQRNRGFTLLELLAGIAIFALISGTLYGALGISLRAFDSAGRRTKSAQQMRVVSDFMQRALEQGYPLALVDQGRWRMLFEGHTGGLRYVANLPGFLGFGGLYEMTFGTTREQGQQHLVLGRRPLIVDKVQGKLRGQQQTQILMEDLESLHLRYYGTVEGADKPGWEDEWRDAKRVPILVEAQIITTDGVVWPPIVARIRVNSIRFQMAAGTLGNTSTGAVISTQVLN